MYFIQKSLLNPILTLIFNIASNTHLNNNKNLSSVMDLPSRSKPCKGNEIKTIPPYFSNFPGHRTNRLTNSLCTLLEKTKALYIYTHQCSNRHGWHHFTHCLWGSQQQWGDEVIWSLPLWFSVAIVQMMWRTLVTTLIGPLCQWCNIAMGVLRSSACCYTPPIHSFIHTRTPPTSTSPKP
jgi:hypothetical protein